MDPNRCNADLVAFALQRQGDGLALGVLILVGGAAAAIAAANPGNPLILLGVAFVALPGLVQIAWRAREGIRITLRALLLRPLLPAALLRRAPGARLRLLDAAPVEGSLPPPAHLRLQIADALARRPLLLRLAGPDAVAGVDPAGVWIARPRPDGGIEPLALLRRRPGR